MYQPFDTSSFNSIKVRLEHRCVACPCRCRPCFNSIKVRLERVAEYGASNLDDMFQFHKGTIRTLKFSATALMILCFNSIKVRLELEDLTKENLRFLFQFHKGTIRTPVSPVKGAFTSSFQFHKGTIRTFC